MAHKALRGVKQAKKLKLSAGLAKKGKKGGESKKEYRRRLSKEQDFVAKNAAKFQGKKGKADAKTVAPKAGVSAASTATPAGGKKSRAAAKALAALERQHLALYGRGERTLLVGEGNFSFAHALCGVLEDCSGVYATAFDSEHDLNKKYPDAAEMRKAIEKAGATTLVGVDATRIHKVKEFTGVFRKIVWNFPHIGGSEAGADVETSVIKHRKLLAHFFDSAAKCLATEHNARIHVALKEGEPYKSWKVVQTLRAACPDFDLVSCVPFAASAFEGYAHRRTMGFDERLSKADSEELAKGAKVYVFGRKKVQD